MSNTDRSKRSQGTYDLQSVYNANNSQENADLYDVWAEDYEQRIGSWGYLSPAVTAGFVGRYVKPKDGTVLDAGAGSGMMGSILTPLGYQDLVGIDLSPNMLELARNKGVYKNLRQMELGRHLDFPSDAFAAVIAVGVFAAGHAPPESLEELIRTTRPGGYVIFSVNTNAYDGAGGFKEKQETLQGEKKWQLVEMTAPFSHLPFEDPELKVRVCTYRVL